MSLAPTNKYVAANVEYPGVEVTKEYNLFNGSIETVTIATSAFTQTVAAVGARELRPYSLVKIAVTSGQFTSNAVLTIDGTNHQPGDRVQFVFTPSDIPSPRTLTIKDSATTPNTLDTLTSTSDASRSTSTRTFVLGTTGTWTLVGDVPSASGSINTTSIKIGSGATVTGILVGTKTWDPGSVTGPNTTSTTVTVTGAAVGDYVVPTLTTLSTAAQLTGYVSGTDTVTVVLGVFTGAVDLASGTLNALVIKAA